MLDIFSIAGAMANELRSTCLLWWQDAASRQRACSYSQSWQWRRWGRLTVNDGGLMKWVDEDKGIDVPG